MLLSCIRDNHAALRQGLTLLTSLTPAQYRQRIPLCFNSTVGGHLRHVIEHYLSLLPEMPVTEVDYEARARDTRIENELDYAAEQLRLIGQRLETLAGTTVNRPLRIKVETAPAQEPEPWSASSLLRELEFLLSHTVHHYALIAIQCQIQGVAVPRDFGMAPSTLRHQQAVARAAAACAP